MIYHHDGLAHYLRQVDKISMLYSEREDLDEKEKLIISNLKLVVMLAKKYSRDPEELLDRIQDGNYGLILAAQTFDQNKGKFLSWATGYIKGAIRNRRTDGLGKPLRRRTNIPEVASIEALDNLYQPVDDPSGLIQQTLDLATVGRVLTQKQRKVIDGRLAGETYQALAVLMGSSPQNIQQIENNALKKIKTSFMM